VGNAGFRYCIREVKEQSVDILRYISLRRHVCNERQFGVVAPRP